MTQIPNSLRAIDQASLIHPQSNLRNFLETGPTIMARGKGIFVYDDEGTLHGVPDDGIPPVVVGAGGEARLEPNRLHDGFEIEGPSPIVMESPPHLPIQILHHSFGTVGTGSFDQSQRLPAFELAGARLL